MLHLTICRRGGRARSKAKTFANRAKAAAYWSKVRAGEVPPPARPKAPPTPDVIAELLAPYCREHGIVRLELFGSSARGHARRGSDVDLIATFNPGHRPTGLRFLGVADELAKLLGVPVDLLTADDIAEMNVYRKTSILAEAREIFSA